MHSWSHVTHSQSRCADGGLGGGPHPCWVVVPSCAIPRRLRLYLTGARQCCKCRYIVRRLHPNSPKAAGRPLSYKGPSHIGSPFRASFHGRKVNSEPPKQGLIIGPHMCPERGRRDGVLLFHRANISDFTARRLVARPPRLHRVGVV